MGTVRSRGERTSWNPHAGSRAARAGAAGVLAACLLALAGEAAPRGWLSGWWDAAPRAGDVAPDFSLPRSQGSGSLRLSSLRGRPVVLIFGSFT